MYVHVSTRNFLKLSFKDCSKKENKFKYKIKEIAYIYIGVVMCGKII